MRYLSQNVQLCSSDRDYYMTTNQNPHCRYDLWFVIINLVPDVGVHSPLSPVSSGITKVTRCCRDQRQGSTLRLAL